MDELKNIRATVMVSDLEFGKQKDDRVSDCDVNIFEIMDSGGESLDRDFAAIELDPADVNKLHLVPQDNHLSRSQPMARRKASSSCDVTTRSLPTARQTHTCEEASGGASNLPQ